MSSLLNQVRDHVKTFNSSQRTRAKDVLTLIGFGLVSYKVLTYASNFVQNFLLPAKDLLTRYGKDSWAIITGGTEGSGKCYAIELAKKGFNIIIISRSAKKFEAVQPEIAKANPNAKIIFIQADFTKCEEPGFWDNIMSKIGDLDVSILINNAAIKYGRYFLNYTDRDLLNSYNINCIAPAMMVRKLVKKMLDRPHRSAIINVGSLAGNIPLPHMINYGTSKYFLSFFSEAIRKEFQHKIDVQYLCPGVFITPTSRTDRKKSVFDCLAENVAKSSLNQLGYQHFTAGHWRHKLHQFFGELLPRSVVINQVKNDAPSRINFYEEFYKNELEQSKKEEEKASN